VKKFRRNLLFVAVLLSSASGALLWAQPGTTDGTPQYDSDDLKNEITRLTSKIASLDQRVIELKGDIGDGLKAERNLLFSLFGLLSGVFAIASFFLLKGREKRLDEREKTIEMTRQIARDDIRDHAQRLMENISRIYDQPGDIEARILGHVARTFDPPSTLKKEILCDIVGLLEDVDILTGEGGRFLRNRIADIYGGEM